MFNGLQSFCFRSWGGVFKISLCKCFQDMTPPHAWGIVSWLFHESAWLKHGVSDVALINKIDLVWDNLKGGGIIFFIWSLWSHVHAVASTSLGYTLSCNIFKIRRTFSCPLSAAFTFPLSYILLIQTSKLHLSCHSWKTTFLWLFDRDASDEDRFHWHRIDLLFPSPQSISQKYTCTADLITKAEADYFSR